jgi:hypothetical protein
MTCQSLLSTLPGMYPVGRRSRVKRGDAGTRRPEIRKVVLLPFLPSDLRLAITPSPKVVGGCSTPTAVQKT